MTTNCSGKNSMWVALLCFHVLLPQPLSPVFWDWAKGTKNTIIQVAGATFSWWFSLSLYHLQGKPKQCLHLWFAIANLGRWRLWVFSCFQVLNNTDSLCYMNIASPYMNPHQILPAQQGWWLALSWPVPWASFQASTHPLPVFLVNFGFLPLKKNQKLSSTWKLIAALIRAGCLPWLTPYHLVLLISSEFWSPYIVVLMIKQLGIDSVLGGILHNLESWDLVCDLWGE